MPHAIIAVVVPAGNIQAEARAVRYAALASWLGERRLDALATAHHAEDQAETVLMRLNRGSGITGLSGIRASAHVPLTDHRLVRPLLTWCKGELERVVSGAGIIAARDPTNDDPSFERVRFRQMIARAGSLDPMAIATSARLLAEAEFTLHRLALEELAECGDDSGDRAYLPYRRRSESIEMMPLWIEVLQEIARTLGCPIGKAEAATLAANLRRGKRSNAGRLEASAERRQNEIAWVLRPERPRRTG